MLLLAETEILFFFDIALLFGVAVMIIIICYTLRISFIISDVHTVKSFAEIGVLLLLFTVGSAQNEAFFFNSPLRKPLHE